MVKILSQIELPELEQHLKAHFPDIELSYLKIGEPVPANTEADCLLAVASNLKGLDKIIPEIKGLRWIQVVGAGVDGFNLEVLGDIVLTTTKGVSAVPISEWVMAMILTQAKSLPAQWIEHPPELWNFGNAPMACLDSQKLAIYGFGAIGRALAKRALSFDMQVSALTRNSVPDIDGVQHARNFADLVADADHLVLAAPSTKATYHILNADSFKHLKSGTHLINIARGELIDESALRTALDDGTVTCASLDVAQNEPLDAEHWFFSDQRIRFSPHISWGDPSTMERMLSIFIENLSLFVSGKTLVNIFDVEAGY
ncbi:MAG: NAD(P)-dependent oxidoreductase [Parvibaculales bacterium]